MSTTVTPQQLVEHALATSTADDCVVIVRAASSANLRWANNTLTTNGVMVSSEVVVVSFVGSGDGTATGSVSGSASTVDQVTALVEAADAAARAAGPAEDVAELVADRTSPDWDDVPEQTDIHVYDAFAPALGEAFGQATAADRVLYGFVDHELVTTFLGSSRGLRLRHTQPTGHYACTAKTTDLSRSAWVGRCHPRLRRRRRAGDGRPGRHPPRLGPAAYRPAGRSLRHDPAAQLGGGPDDRRLLGRRRPGRPRGRVGLQPARRRHPHRRADRPHGASTSTPTRRTPPWPARRSTSPRASDNTESVFDNGLPLGRTDWIRDGDAHLAAPDPALGRDDRPAGHPDGRQPGARGRRRRAARSRTWWPAPSAACW